MYVEFHKVSVLDHVCFPAERQYMTLRWISLVISLSKTQEIGRFSEALHVIKVPAAKEPRFTQNKYGDFAMLQFLMVKIFAKM